MKFIPANCGVPARITRTQACLCCHGTASCLEGASAPSSIQAAAAITAALSYKLTMAATAHALLQQCDLPSPLAVQKLLRRSLALKDVALLHVCTAQQRIAHGTLDPLRFAHTLRAKQPEVVQQQRASFSIPAPSYDMAWHALSESAHIATCSHFMALMKHAAMHLNSISSRSKLVYGACIYSPTRPVTHMYGNSHVHAVQSLTYLQSSNPACSPLAGPGMPVQRYEGSPLMRRSMPVHINHVPRMLLAQHREAPGWTEAHCLPPPAGAACCCCTDYELWP